MPKPNPITFQPLPVALLFGLTSLMDGNSFLQSSNAATVELKMTEESLTQSSPILIGPAGLAPVGCHGLALQVLARIALPQSRPLENWEKKAADEFFWSQFS
jgi:hypothetical protein